MVEFLSCVGFNFPETDSPIFWDRYIQMLEHYEATSSQKVTAPDYLILRADPLELLFQTDAQGDANADMPELFYQTGRWQPITSPEWLKTPRDTYITVANALTEKGISLNVCVPGAYAVDFLPETEYEMQAACFATICHIFSEDRFLSSKKNMAPMSLINKGSFLQDASCLANGRITEIKLYKNAYSNCEYYHFTAQCEDIVLDILANRNIVSQNAHIGDIISVDGWLFGKFRPKQKNRPE